jgi:hypothetical protein
MNLSWSARSGPSPAAPELGDRCDDEPTTKARPTPMAGRVVDEAGEPLLPRELLKASAVTSTSSRAVEVHGHGECFRWLAFSMKQRLTGQ